MRNLITCLAISLPALTGCYSAGDTPQKEEKKPAGFVFKETIVTGKDTGMTNLGGFKRTAIKDVICQHWECDENDNTTSNELLWDDRGRPIHPRLDLFKDGSALLNPGNNLQTGSWRIIIKNKTPALLLSFGGTGKVYSINHIQSNKLELTEEADNEKPLRLTLSSDALIHQDMYSDPFHPSNNRWRFKPAARENDSALHTRVKQCVKFYALYFRDNIMRQKNVISFEGLPEIFRWYSGGIGLPDKEDISSSWINCFYNKAQALEGYEMLRRLIIDYEFDWPKKAPSWVHQTHAVLEQMYHKL